MSDSFPFVPETIPVAGGPVFTPGAELTLICSKQETNVAFASALSPAESRDALAPRPTVALHRGFG